MIIRFVAIAAYFVLGLAVGAAHFHGLRENTRLWVEGRGNLRPALAHVARLSLVALVFFLVSRAGAAPLLASFAGFVVARPIYVALTRGPK